MNEDNLKLLVASLLVLIASVIFNLTLMTDKVADKVIHRLKRDYVPGPYEPGFDPDKVPPGSLNTKR